MPEAIPKTSGSKKPALRKQGAITKVKAPRPKQPDLPTMENRDIPEIEQAAEAYRDVRDERCELSKQEATAKQTLITVMKAHKRTVYTRNGLSITLEEIDNVKVKTAKKDDEGDEE